LEAGLDHFEAEGDRRAARKMGVPLVALSANAELLANIRKPGGMVAASAAFGRGAFQRLSSTDPGFQSYVNATLLPAYAAHVRAGLLPGKPSFDDFYADRIVRDEVMAFTADAYIATHPDALLVCLLGIDHIKFPRYGVPGRLARRAADREAAAAVAANGTAGALQKSNPLDIKTVLLNPTATDAYNQDDGGLMLDLPGRHSAVANLLWFSSELDGTPVWPERKGWHLPAVEELVF
jgi:Haem-binding uptake, Tiki superfamily, ChaN